MKWFGNVEQMSNNCFDDDIIICKKLIPLLNSEITFIYDLN